MTQEKTLYQRLIKFIFYGNFFYGFCVVATMLEAVVELKLPLSGAYIYCTAFVATVLFYNYPYARNYSAPSTNPRTQWYIRNHNLVITIQVVFTIVLLLLVSWFLKQHHEQIKNLDALQWFLVLTFPITGAMYYGANFLSRKRNLRQIGWLKPFVIGFVWAGMCNVYPALYYDILHAKPFEFTLFGNMLFLKNLMFISMLAIMFDIKDYAVDSKSRLNTLVVKIGLRKIIFYVLIPLTLLGLLTFISYAATHRFSPLKMVLLMIPFFLLLATAMSFKKRRSLMYYLVVIDGLLIVKAVFGILAMIV